MKDFLQWFKDFFGAIFHKREEKPAEVSDFDREVEYRVRIANIKREIRQVEKSLTEAKAKACSFEKAGQHAAAINYAKMARFITGRLGVMNAFCAQVEYLHDANKTAKIMGGLTGIAADMIKWQGPVDMIALSEEKMMMIQGIRDINVALVNYDHFMQDVSDEMDILASVNQDIAEESLGDIMMEEGLNRILKETGASSAAPEKKKEKVEVEA